ncbi:dihydrodipicolinate synthase family protein, partial [Dubosiella newyorkensis]
MIKGSIVALITPFHEDGSVNFEKLKELVEFQIANHTDGILV